MRSIQNVLRLAAVLALALSAAPALADPLAVVATTTDLGSLAAEVGGAEVEVTTLTKGPEDPHFIEPRPSFIRVLHDADLFLLDGMELEIGWAPVLLQSARNPRVLPGAEGHLDASTAIVPLEIPTGRVDRSMGDVHPYGNPHYLTDPLNGLRVARGIRDRLTDLRPAQASVFAERYRDFARRLVGRLVGDDLASRYDPEELATRVEDGTLDAFLHEHPEPARLGGWLGALRAHAGAKAIQDHKLWAYFARRFELDVVETLEPRPGIAPTTRHLAEVVEQVRAQQVRLILSSPYFDPRHARWVAEQTGARVANMAHQVGSRDGTGDYLATIDHNVREVLAALS